jgi:hypothetical protein
VTDHELHREECTDCGAPINWETLADAKLLEANAALTEKLAESDAKYKSWSATAIEQQMQKFAAIDIADKAEEQLSRLRALVDKQAEDEGLWFAAQTAPEAYLQAQLRLLHAVIEDAGD